VRPNDVDTILGGPGEVARIVRDNEQRATGHRQFDHEVVTRIAAERAQEKIGLPPV
jgi:hypothetical protein